MDRQDLGLYFVFFNEIGIIDQLIRALLEAKLPKGFLISHFSVLNHLIRVKDGQTPRVLARAFQVPKNTMTHTLSVLERHALIEIRPNPKDKRSKCVFITATGRALREQAIDDIAPDLQAVADRFPPDKLSKIVPYLADIRQFLDDYRN
ncbi:MAG: MarR family transcriptional regulator [Gammaproteobacteria bacterium]|nr:MarR family transcriptional regulator [Gammaproteobacteria bacterium]